MSPLALPKFATGTFSNLKKRKGFIFNLRFCLIQKVVEWFHPDLADIHAAVVRPDHTDRIHLHTMTTTTTTTVMTTATIMATIKYYSR